MNESIAVQKEKVKDKLKVDMKYNQLQKLETKIETNLNSHRKTLQFLKIMIIVLLVHNLLIKNSRRVQMQSRAYNNFKTRERSISTRRRINTPRRKWWKWEKSQTRYKT